MGNALFVPNDVTEGMLAKVRILPLPLSIHEPKGGQGPSHGSYSARTPWWNQPQALSTNLCKEKERDGLACPLPRGDEQDRHSDLYPRAEYKRVKTDDYLFRQGQVWQRVRPRLGVLMRNQVPTARRDGKPRRAEENPALFGEQVIWEEQAFVADLRFADRSRAEEFVKAAGSLLHPDSSGRGWLRVGRGGRPVRIESRAWNPALVPAESPSDHLTLTLTSDLIARAPWLTFLADLTVVDLKQLIEQAGCQVPSGENLQLAYKVCEPVEIYGFNSATGLPRAAALAIKRGSVFRLQGEKEALESWRQALAALVEQGKGLGERTVEGFGRFVLDLDLHEQRYWENAPAGEKPEPAGVANWRDQILKRVLTFLDRHRSRLFDARGKSGPTPSQWQWLRNGARTATTDRQVEELLANLKDRAARLGSRVQWKGLADALAAEVKEIEGEERVSALRARKAFLDELARVVVAQIRQQRNREEAHR